MKNLIIAIAVLAIFAGMASARGVREVPTLTPYDGQHSTSRAVVEVFYDDLESGAVGWTHGDDSVKPPQWHIDSYLAHTGNSWWCGSFAFDADGGYGNRWKQWLTSPYIDWEPGDYPVIEYNFRADCEKDFDFGYAQAESLGAFVNLNKGYTHRMPWGMGGYFLGNKDDPARIRFFFESDLYYSDADGLYESVGGGMHVDNVVVFDTNTSAVYWTDDADANISLVATAPTVPAGDFWTLASNNCQAYSDPHVWTVTSPDTTVVPVNLENWLMTPVIDISGFECVQGCTLYTIFQLFMDASFGGGWTEQTSVDGGATWFTTGAWHGSQCDYGYGPCDHFLFGFPLMGPGMPQGTQIAGRWIMNTDALGQGPDPDCTFLSAGITIDDTWIELTECPPNPVEESSWGKIKSMYR